MHAPPSYPLQFLYGLNYWSEDLCNAVLHYDRVPGNAKKLNAFKRRPELRMEVSKQVIHQT